MKSSTVRFASGAILVFGAVALSACTSPPSSLTRTDTEAIEATGATGPTEATGSQAPKGPQGFQGPQGPSAQESIYSEAVTATPANWTGGVEYTYSASCQAGDSAVWGGWDTWNFAPLVPVDVKGQAISNETFTVVFTPAANIGGANVIVTVLCLAAG